jgi:site-specific DNA-methyltransferase (adenine-specific)
MQFMAEVPDKYYDLAIVDPPYGIGANKMTLGNGKKRIYRGQNDWDSSIPSEEYFNELKRVSKNQIIWGGNYMTEYLKPTSSWLFWDKGTGENDFADGELAWSSFGGALRKFTKSWVGANAKDESERIHPTQKPVALYEWLLSKYAKPNDKIFDSHGGSGSIAIAVDKANTLDKTNYSLDIIELDKDYFDASLNRFKQYKSQTTLF